MIGKVLAAILLIGLAAVIAFAGFYFKALIESEEDK